MADRRVKVNLDLDASGYESGARKAKGATDDLGNAVDSTKGKTDQSQTSMQKLTGFVRENDQAMQTAGRTITTVGVGLTALAVGATKAAIDWESSWADVQKVNDGTSEQMQQLESDLREMARTIPATHEEIAAVAEAAGRLGVEVDSVAEFSRVMIDLGNTTDMTADQAATAFARFTEIMGTGTDNVDRLGSTVVDLGNNFAATETEIVEMGMRIAGAGNQIGLTEAEVMGLSTALSAVGIEAQAGGSAISRVMIDIESAVSSGGEELEKFAEASGMSSAEFKQAWEEDAAGALVSLVDGLSNADEQGTTTMAMLEDLGITNLRTRDAMLRLAGSGDVLADAFETGNTAFEENTALSEEAAIRYETTAMQIKTAWASIQDAFISAGSAIAPAVGNVAEGIGTVADAFGSLPDPVLNAVTALSGVAGVAALGAGGLLLLAPRAVETWDAFRRLQKSAGPVPRLIRNVGKAAGVAGAGLAVLLVVDSLTDHFNIAVGTTEEFETQLRLLKDGAQEGAEGLDDLFAARDYSTLGLLPTGIRDLDSAINALDTGAFMEFLEEGVTLFGLFGDTAQDIALEGLEQFDTAMSSMVSSGDLDSAAAGFREFATAAEEAGWSTDRIIDATPEYQSALQSLASEQGYALEGAELYQAALGNLPPELENVVAATDDAAQQDELTGALEEVGVAADGTVDSLGEYLDMLFETGMAHRSEQEAHRQYTESLDEFGDTVDQLVAEHGSLNGAIDETTGLFSTSTDVGIEAGRAFDGIAEAGENAAQAMAENGASQEEVQESLEGTYDSLVEAAGAFVETEGEAEALARAALGIPEGVDIETWMDEEAQSKADELSDSIDEIPDGLYVIAEMNASAREEAFKTGAAIDEIDGYKKVDVAVSEDGTAGQVQSRIDSVTGKVEYVFVDEDGTTTTVQQQIINIDGVTRHVYVDDDGTIYATQGEINAVQDGSSTIHVTESGLTAVENALNRAARNRTANISVVTSAPTQARPSYALGGETGGRVSRDFGVKRLASGGRLPYTGLGTDKILGVNSSGMPLALVDDLEWVINRGSSDKYDGLLSRVNQDHPSVQHLAHLNSGGRATGREWTASSFGNTTGFDYQRLASALGGRDNIEQHMHLHTANASITDGIDGFNRMNMSESRR